MKIKYGVLERKVIENGNRISIIKHTHYKDDYYRVIETVYEYGIKTIIQYVGINPLYDIYKRWVEDNKKK